MGGLGLFILVYVLNVADAVLTYVGLSLGAIELNPLMSALIQQGWAWFFAFKILVMPLGLWFLWQSRTQKYVLAGLTFLAAVYTAVVLMGLLAVLDGIV